MNRRSLHLTLLLAFSVLPFLQRSSACGYDYVSDCATTLDIEINGITNGFHVSTCPYLSVFNNYNFGSPSSLQISVAKAVTWESCNNFVYNAKFYYRIYQQGSSPGNFSNVELQEVNITTFGNYRTRYRENQLNLDLLSGLSPGDYFIEIYFTSDVSFNQGNVNMDDAISKNNNGSFYKASFNVGTPQGGTLDVNLVSQQNNSCNGSNDGSATVTTQNGTPPISYTWSNGTTGPTANNLSAGNYTVTATDANGDSGTLNVTISQPAPINANLSIIDASSTIANDGEINAQPTGGTSPYSYNWDNGFTAEIITGLSPDSYTVTITDANGCTATSTALIGISGNNPTSYCTSSGDFPWVDWMTNVTFNNIDNDSGKSSYSDFTNISTNLNIGSSHPISIENSYSWQTYDEYIRVWIDYNQNGSFEEPAEIAFEGISAAPPLGTTSSITTGTVIIPNTATQGLTRMRISLKRGDYPGPCESIPFGEVEDYTLNLLDNGPVACSITSDITNLDCNNNGTPTDPSDDTYQFNLLVNAIGGSGTNWTAMINAQQYVGTYGIPVLVGNLPIAGGPISFTITDVTDDSCETIQSATPPSPCSSSSPCSISANASPSLCDDNGTPTDPSDDTYTFDLNVTGTSTGSSWTATILGQSQSGPYNTPIQMGPYPIDQGVQDISIFDNSIQGCNTGVTISPPPACSNVNGINYCSSSSGFPWHDWIAGILFEDIDNGSDKTPYSDFTNISTTLTKGNSYPIAMTCGFSWYTHDEYWKIWIDYNQNGTFDEPDEIAYSGLEAAPTNGTTIHTVFGNISIPSTALEGLTRMRVSMKRDGEPSPCEAIEFGEVEDYTINISNSISPPDDQLFLNINGSPNTTHVNLYALVQTNMPNTRWVLEKSTNQTDYTAIYTGQTATNGRLLIEEIDQQPVDGINTYRIKLLDENDQLLQHAQTDVPFLHVPTFGLFPNPTSRQCSIQLAELLEKKVRIEIYNQLGQAVYRIELPSVNRSIHLIDTQTWRDGIYQVMIFTEGRRMASRSLVIQH